MYKQISPANGWHFVSKDEPNGKPIVCPVAAWGLTEEGAVVGLIGEVFGGGNIELGPQHNGVVRLVGVPPIPGMYKHESAMTAAEVAAIKPSNAG